MSLLSELGRGEFGVVMEGAAVNLPGQSNGITPVAIKSLHQSTSNRELHLFMSEAVRAAKLNHTNVVRLLAVCFTGQPSFLVFEFMSNGDLKTYLSLIRQSQTEGMIGTPHMLKLTRDVAAGFAYLASLDVVHRDLAARNVLLDSHFTAKLGDLGLARQLYQSEV